MNSYTQRASITCRTPQTKLSRYAGTSPGKLSVGALATERRGGVGRVSSGRRLSEPTEMVED